MSSLDEKSTSSISLEEEEVHNSFDCDSNTSFDDDIDIDPMQQHDGSTTTSNNHKRFGTSVYQRSRNPSFIVRKERKNRGKLRPTKTSCVEDWLNGNVSEDRSHDISIYEAEEETIDDSITSTKNMVKDFVLDTRTTTMTPPPPPPPGPLQTTITNAFEAGSLNQTTWETLPKQQQIARGQYRNTQRSGDHDHDDDDDDHEAEEALQWTTLAKTPETSFTTDPMVVIDDDDDDDDDSHSAPSPTNRNGLVCKSPDLSPIIMKQSYYYEEVRTRTPETLPCTPPGSDDTTIKLRNSLYLTRELSLPMTDNDELAWKPTRLIQQTNPMTVASGTVVPNQGSWARKDNCSTSSSKIFVSGDNCSIHHNNNKNNTIPNETGMLQSHDNDANTRPPLYDGIRYQDVRDSIAIMSSVESKRQCWFQNEMANAQTEWEYYRSGLVDTIHQATKLEELIATFHLGLVQYSQHLTELIHDTTNATTTTTTTTTTNHSFFWNHATTVTSSLSRKHRAKLRSLQTRETVILAPLTITYRNVLERLQEHIPAMTECLMNATVYKQLITLKAEDLTERGKRIQCMDDSIYQAESQVQEAFAIFMDVLNEYDARDKHQPRHGHSSSSNGCNNHQQHQHKTSDRWLAEVSYRSASRNVLSVWKMIRRQQEELFREMIRLEMNHKRHEYEILSEFLPLQHGMIRDTREALERGLDHLLTCNVDRVQSEQQYQNWWLENDRDDPSSSRNDKKKKKKNCSIEMKLGENAYVKEHRYLEVKTTTGWQSALVVVTRDETLHVFTRIITTTTTTTTCNNNNHNSSSSNNIGGRKQPMKIVVDENEDENDVFQHDQLPYISIVPSHYEISRQGMEIELLRPGRSKLFRKRQDYCVFRLSNEMEAMVWFDHLHQLTECGIHC